MPRYLFLRIINVTVKFVTYCPVSDEKIMILDADLSGCGIW